MTFTRITRITPTATDVAPDTGVADRSARTARPVVQRKMQVGSSDDPMEREADAMADQVMRRLAATPGERGAVDGVSTAATNMRIRRMGNARAASMSFAAPPEVESGIARASGRGAPLAPKVRSRFEGAMGVDLGAVRVHHDSSADRLNRSVSAKAFTTGNDVFFSQGAYRPDTGDGQHLLAHELAHTVQQSGSVRRTTIHRFSIDKPDFTRATGVTVSQHGGGGYTAEVTDGRAPLIVKSNQTTADEVVISGNLHAALSKAHGKSDGFQVKAPKSRLATGNEKATLAQVVPGLLPNGMNPRNFIAGLTGNDPTIIAEKADGTSFRAATTTEVDDNNFNNKSIISALVSSPGPFTTLARAAAVDVVMGMDDRFFNTLYNPDNFLYDAKKKTFRFIDNTKKEPSGYLTDHVNDLNLTNRQAFDGWARNPIVDAAVNDVPGLANNMFDTICGFGQMDGLASVTFRRSHPNVYAALNDALRDGRDQLVGYLEAGLTTGLRTLQNVLTNPAKLVKGIRPTQRFYAIQSLLARGYVLAGQDPNTAWANADVAAANVEARPAPQAQQPQVPQRPAQQLPAQQPPAPQRAAPQRPAAQQPAAQPRQWQRADPR